jgi:hypothetical protein
VKAKLVPLIEKIKVNPLPDVSFLEHKFEVDKQIQLNHQIAKDIGFDMVRERYNCNLPTRHLEDWTCLYILLQLHFHQWM